MVSSLERVSQCRKIVAATDLSSFQTDARFQLPHQREEEARDCCASVRGGSQEEKYPVLCIVGQIGGDENYCTKLSIGIRQID